jgi:hypothetical protein
MMFELGLVHFISPFLAKPLDDASVALSSNKRRPLPLEVTGIILVISEEERYLQALALRRPESVWRVHPQWPYVVVQGQSHLGLENPWLFIRLIDLFGVSP